MSSNFSVSGLSTGMDSQSIIDKLVSLEQQPIKLLQDRQAAYKTQVSTLGDIASKLSALRTSASDLGVGGLLALKATSTNTAFTATPGSSAAEGSYDVAVTSLASAAKWRSGAIASGATLQAGTFSLGMAGHDPITVTDGETLAKLAADINGSGAPVTASVLEEGGSRYLSITAKKSGTASAMNVTFTASGGADPLKADPSTPGTAWTEQQAGRDAVFSVDGLQFTRSSNTVTDALPGTTLQLLKVSPLDTGVPPKPIPEALALAADADSTKEKLQKFVDAYNEVMKLVQAQLSVSSTTDRTTSLAGDSTVRGLQQSLQAFSSSKISELGTVRSLADLGVKTERDGTLSIDSDMLADAIARDPGAVNDIFSVPDTGVGMLTSRLVNTYSAYGSGLLSLRQKGLNTQISSIDMQTEAMQTRLDSFREMLVKQFAAMEKVVGQYKNIGTFLSQQSNFFSSST
jgi:flagellar hook-associated protein 2